LKVYIDNNECPDLILDEEEKLLIVDEEEKVRTDSMLIWKLRKDGTKVTKWK
jgi:hypothetical protein